MLASTPSHKIFCIRIYWTHSNIGPAAGYAKVPR